MKNTKTQTDNTLELLNSISRHLSGRKDCKGVEYRVRLCTEDANNPYSKYQLSEVEFTPEVKVFPSTKCRAEYQKEPILYHILTRHYPHWFEGMRPSGNCAISSNTIIPGIYIYRVSANKKYRRWERIR